MRRRLLLAVGAFVLSADRKPWVCFAAGRLHAGRAGRGRGRVAGRYAGRYAWAGNVRAGYVL